MAGSVMNGVMEVVIMVHGLYNMQLNEDNSNRFIRLLDDVWIMMNGWDDD